MHGEADTSEWASLTTKVLHNSPLKCVTGVWNFIKNANFLFVILWSDSTNADDQCYYSIEELAAQFEQHYCCTEIVRKNPNLCVGKSSTKQLVSSDSGNSST